MAKTSQSCPDQHNPFVMHTYTIAVIAQALG